MPQTDRFVIATATALVVGRPETARDLVEQVRADLGGGSADLCLFFASAHFENEVADLSAELYERLGPRAMIGTSAEAVISGDSEFEHQPAAVLWAAHLPDTSVVSFHLDQEDLERLAQPQELHEHLGVDPATNPSFILLGDPFSVSPLMLDRLASAYPERPAIGGMASAAETPENNAMIFDGQTLRTGWCGVALHGATRFDTVVSQGARPIGRHLIITKAERNVIQQLGGKPTMLVVRDLLNESSAADVELVKRGGLLVGRVINEYQSSFATGDFLIRSPVGFDPNTGAMAVNDLVRIGQTVQFHVRDAATASNELDTLLRAAPRAGAAGALLFTCNGRGSRLYAERHHDARAIHSAAGRLPVAGFFCAGEIGPIGKRNFLHGHTASIGFFRRAGAAHS